MPVTWNETLPLDGKVSEHILIAKRNGEQWYIGAITADDARNYNVKLGFLAKGKTYDVEIIADTADSEDSPRHYQVIKQTMQRGDTLQLTLVKGGGAAIKLTPRN